MRVIRSQSRLLTVIALALIVLVALIAATGGVSNGPSSPTVAPPAAEGPTAVSGNGFVRGTVSAAARHESGRTWQFTYTVRNTGLNQIAGFQLNASRPANLFRVRQKAAWTFFGSGVCGGQYPGVLIYWSTGSPGPHTIPPGQTGHFEFAANTGGPASINYSLSYGSARPQFGTVEGPAGSNLPTSGSCRK